MDKLEQISFKDKKAIFERLERIASQANLTKEERAQYEAEWKIYNDYFNTIESAEKKAAAEAWEKAMEAGMEKGMQAGMEKGMQAGMEKSALNLKALGMSTEFITQATGLSAEEIEAL